MKPAQIPMTLAAHGATNAHGAVMATKPASIPLHDIEMSGLPYLALVHAMAVTNPKHAANNVLTATTEMRRSVAPNVEPGLNPIQPNNRIMVPMTTYPRLWPGIAFGDLSLLNFPMRGPRMMAKASAVKPPVACTTPEPAKSTAPWPQPRLSPSLARKPPPHTQLP